MPTLRVKGRVTNMYPKRGLGLKSLEIEFPTGILDKWFIEKSIQVTMWENQGSRLGWGKAKQRLVSEIV